MQDFEPCLAEKGHTRRLLALLQERWKLQAAAIKSATFSQHVGCPAHKASSLLSNLPTMKQIERERKETQLGLCSVPSLARPTTNAEQLDSAISAAADPLKGQLLGISMRCLQ
jgi:hypothetical protein